MAGAAFENLLKILEAYKLKQVPRNSSNHYTDEKDGVFYRRRETDAEHVYSALRLADFFLTTEEEFSSLDKSRVYDILLYHDDTEILTRDVGISDLEERDRKDDRERLALSRLSVSYPAGLDAKLLLMDAEYRENATPEAWFAHAIDKMDAMVHELQYPQDWGPKGFVERTVREWFQPSFDYSPTFSRYFEEMIRHLKDRHYFDVTA